MSQPAAAPNLRQPPRPWVWLGRVPALHHGPDRPQRGHRWGACMGACPACRPAPAATTPDSGAIGSDPLRRSHTYAAHTDGSESMHCVPYMWVSAKARVGACSGRSPCIVCHACGSQPRPGSGRALVGESCAARRQSGAQHHAVAFLPSSSLTSVDLRQTSLWTCIVVRVKLQVLLCGLVDLQPVARVIWSSRGFPPDDVAQPPEQGLTGSDGGGTSCWTLHGAQAQVSGNGLHG